MRAALLPRRDLGATWRATAALRDRGHGRGPQRLRAHRRELVARRGPRLHAAAPSPRGSGRSRELAPAVFLAPEHRELVTGAPSARRRFLDRLVLGLKPAAGDDLVRYSAALRERNALLARWKSGAAGQRRRARGLDGGARPRRLGRAPPPHRGARGLGSRFPAARARAPAVISPTIEAAYTGGDDSADEMRTAVGRVAALERRRGYTLAGPQRDDLIWRRRGRALAAEASSGEIARTVALAKLAEWKRRREGRGRAPALRRRRFRRGPLGGFGRGVFRDAPARRGSAPDDRGAPGALVASGGGRPGSAGRRGRRRGAAAPCAPWARDRESDEHRLHHRFHQAAEGPGGRPQAARHVHRGHRRPLGPAPHGLRARRQRDRRGPGRLRRPLSASRSTPTTPSRSRTTAAASRSGCTRSTSARRSRSS